MKRKTPHTAGPKKPTEHEPAKRIFDGLIKSLNDVAMEWHNLRVTLMGIEITGITSIEYKSEGHQPPK